MFNIDKMAAVASIKIKEFAEKHPDETFYAFSIDAAHLCCNSNAMFLRTLKRHQAKFPDKYKDPNRIRFLKRNTSDWAYNDFYTLTDEDGFDTKACEEHGLASYDAQKTSAYTVAMGKLIEELNNRKAFDCFRKSDDFTAGTVAFSY
jgi:hypothetical protein